MFTDTPLYPAEAFLWAVAHEVTGCQAVTAEFMVVHEPLPFLERLFAKLVAA